MRIDSRFPRLAALLPLLCLFLLHSPVAANAESNGADDRSLTVYTTARDTDLRLTRRAGQRFNGDGRIAEASVALYVDPQNQFQTFLGIGGALTDASAEVFARKNVGDWIAAPKKSSLRKSTPSTRGSPKRWR